MKKAELLKIKKEGNALVKKVVNVILDQGTTNEMETYMKQLLEHGCASGMVTELIYYDDTTAFYKKYKKEISAMLKETLSEFGYESPAELFGDKWDDEDFWAEDTQNQNLLAWFGFEETVRNIANRLEMEY